MEGIFCYVKKKKKKHKRQNKNKFHWNAIFYYKGLLYVAGNIYFQGSWENLTTALKDDSDEEQSESSCEKVVHFKKCNG